MKRPVTFLLTAVLLLGLLCGCGSGEYMTTSAGTVSYDTAQAVSEEAASGSGVGYDTSATLSDSQAKIIYTADLDLETTDFDGAVSALASLTEELGAIMSPAASISGAAAIGMPAIRCGYRWLSIGCF